MEWPRTVRKRGVKGCSPDRGPRTSRARDASRAVSSAIAGRGGYRQGLSGRSAERGSAAPRALTVAHSRCPRPSWGDGSASSPRPPMLLSLIVCAPALAAPGPQDALPPHIVVVMVDDLGARDTSPAVWPTDGMTDGSPRHFLTPHLDGLAKQGLVLD